MSDLHLQAITKSFPGLAYPVLDSLDMHVFSGETVALLGQSGCGKTTLLRIIAGFIDPDHGRVVRGEQILAEKGYSMVPEKRRIGFVFQDFALFPHLSAAENIGYGVSRNERKERSAHMLELVGMAGYGNRYPHELSGGQQQRIAIARALAPRPQLLLMDEPFNNLDAEIKANMLAFVREILDQYRITTVMVSHDFHEAELLAHRCAVIESGVVAQYDHIKDMKEHPVSNFISRISTSDYRR
ncbi:MAG: ABC transporter ATP-binding protein [Spirochaetota bacterium]